MKIVLLKLEKFRLKLAKKMNASEWSDQNEGL